MHLSASRPPPRPGHRHRPAGRDHPNGMISAGSPAHTLRNTRRRSPGRRREPTEMDNVWTSGVPATTGRHRAGGDGSRRLRDGHHGHRRSAGQPRDLQRGRPGAVPRSWRRSPASPTAPRPPPPPSRRPPPSPPLVPPATRLALARRPRRRRPGPRPSATRRPVPRRRRRPRRRPRPRPRPRCSRRHDQHQQQPPGEEGDGDQFERNEIPGVGVGPHRSWGHRGHPAHRHRVARAPPAPAARPVDGRRSRHADSATTRLRWRARDLGDHPPA